MYDYSHAKAHVSANITFLQRNLVYVHLFILPLDGLVEYIAVSGIFVCKSIASVLHADHYERLRAVVAHRALTGRSDAYDRAFFDREDVAVDLKFAFAGEEEI